MDHTDIDYTGWKNGECRWIATKFSGPGSEKRNARTVARMVKEGYEIREMPRDEACAAHLVAIS